MPVYVCVCVCVSAKIKRGYHTCLATTTTTHHDIYYQKVICFIVPIIIMAVLSLGFKRSIVDFHSAVLGKVDI